MNKQDLIKELTEFINSEAVTETDGEVELGEVAEQISDRLAELDGDDDSDETVDEDDDDSDEDE